MEQSFIPVLLGSDMNAYGMARAFHEAYGIKSLVLDRSHLTATQHSSILKFQQVEKLNEPKVFISTMDKIAKQYENRKLLLLACGDDYVNLIIKHKPTLQENFIIPYIDEDLMHQILLNENFFRMCDKYGFKYPTTVMVSFKTYKDFEVPLKYPIIIKASNSVAYCGCSFPGKKKMFLAHNEREKDAILKAIYDSTYKDHLIIQEYIPGDDTYMRVLNAYVGKDGKVKLMCLGNPLLEEFTPEGMVRYAAIITTYDEKLMDKVRFFLEYIGFTGFVNFDMKYDVRDGEYKLFEINLRNGRSSYYVTASGYNLMKYVADDYIFRLKQNVTYAKNKHLWTIIPNSVIFKYTKNEKLKIEAKSLIHQGTWTNSLYYSKDMNFKRWLKLKLNNINYYRNYKKYYKQKGLKL